MKAAKDNEKMIISYEKTINKLQREHNAYTQKMLEEEHEYITNIYHYCRENKINPAYALLKNIPDRLPRWCGKCRVCMCNYITETNYFHELCIKNLNECAWDALHRKNKKIDYCKYLLLREILGSDAASYLIKYLAFYPQWIHNKEKEKEDREKYQTNNNYW